MIHGDAILKGLVTHGDAKVTVTCGDAKVTATYSDEMLKGPVNDGERPFCRTS
jgi:hypothetical protein